MRNRKPTFDEVAEKAVLEVDEDALARREAERLNRALMHEAGKFKLTDAIYTFVLVTFIVIAWTGIILGYNWIVGLFR